jgi:hypothetical protein
MGLRHLVFDDPGLEAALAPYRDRLVWFVDDADWV